MTITLKPDQARLIDEAIQAGLIKSADDALEIAVDTLRDRLEASRARRDQGDVRPIWEIIAETMKSVPPEEFAKLPKDGASEIDHYLYGHPKRNQ